MNTPPQYVDPLPPALEGLIKFCDEAIVRWRKVQFQNRCLAFMNFGFAINNGIYCWAGDSILAGGCALLSAACGCFSLWTISRTGRRLKTLRTLRRDALLFHHADTLGKMAFYADQLLAGLDAL